MYYEALLMQHQYDGPLMQHQYDGPVHSLQPCLTELQSERTSASMPGTMQPLLLLLLEMWIHAALAAAAHV